MGTWRECRPSHVNMNGPFPTFNPSVQLVQLDHRRNKEKSLGESQILRIYWRSTVLGLLCSNVNNIISTRGHKSQSQKPSPSLRFLKIEQILHLSSFLCLPPPVLLLREIYQIGANWGRGLSSPREQALSDFKIWGCHMMKFNNIWIRNCIGAGKILLRQNSLRFSSDLGNDTFCFHAISVDSKLPPTQKVCFLLHSFENHNFVKNSRSWEFIANSTQ